jgi:thiamine pyrophosphokinase
VKTKRFTKYCIKQQQNKTKMTHASRGQKQYFTQDITENADVLDLSFLLGKQLNSEQMKHMLGKNKLAMIALNHPIGDKFWPLWQMADMRLTDVGGAENLCDASKNLKQEMTPKNIAPTCIIGNLQRLGKACGWEKHGTKTIEAVDEMKSDLERILEYLQANENQPRADIVLVYGAISPRLDKLLTNLSVMAKFSVHFKRLIFVDEQNISEMLRPGAHKLKMEGLSKDKNMKCGLFPVCGHSNEVATQGLKWDLTGQQLQMGTFVSNSNLVENETVMISAADPVLFSVGIGGQHAQKQHVHA